MSPNPASSPLQLSQGALRRRTPDEETFTVDAVLRHRRETDKEPDVVVNWDHPIGRPCGENGQPKPSRAPFWVQRIEILDGTRLLRSTRLHLLCAVRCRDGL